MLKIRPYAREGSAIISSPVFNKLPLFRHIAGYDYAVEEIDLRRLVPEAAGAFHSISNLKRGVAMELVRRLWSGQEGQDIAEYAVMLAVILVIVVGTVRLIGSNANNVFSSVASSIQ